MAELHLYQLADGIVYFIDVADSERFEESRIELNVCTLQKYVYT